MQLRGAWQGVADRVPTVPVRGLLRRLLGSYCALQWLVLGLRVLPLLLPLW